MATAINPHTLVSCPYNVAHQIERYRMQVHLEKCRRQHPTSTKVNCPFDATHVVNEPELDYHVTVCPKRDIFDQQRYVIEDTSRYTSRAEPACVPPAEENWDNDNYTSYQPDASKSNSIIRKIKGATPSERRKARMEGVKNYKPDEN